MNGFGGPEGPRTLPEWPTHRMTLRIYRVSPETGERTRVRSLVVVEREPWMPPADLSNPCGFPPCACPMHRSENGESGDTEA
ncbi:hypothetical protein [Streptomyces iconiensis]|uniref:Uncharacterized protein n=1 Tax=Streptomyces iconiensis TaxID=1384038 RepID=A0ABT6ZS99_9ACTN|nr:hypothetical protein [Streptomyces iconiensis]MDJ1131742.1 hypothetical protein [Streptomyces iconiensis]